MKLEGLSSQIALSMAAMAFGVTLLVVVTAHAFYYMTFRYWPTHYTQTRSPPASGRSRIRRAR